MKRRQFLQTGSLVSLPVLFGGLELSAITRSALFGMVNNGDDRVLVLIQLNGGNDGLNMVIPIDQYQGLNAVRPNLVIPESMVLKMKDTTGLHPSMTGMHTMFQEEKLAVVQSVGYPNQNRSHFRSTDIWTTASEADEFLATGWAGRYLDNKFPGYPDAYPNNDCPDPFAITIGGVVSETCQGMASNFSFTLTSKTSVRLVEETVAAAPDGTCYSNEVEYIRKTIKQSNDYATTVLTAFDKGANIATYPADNNLANQLKLVANLISGGLGTKIYVVNIGGFDTHANQVLIGEPENGAHATLLKNLSDAVAAFSADCAALGIQERVVGMTFSEFGRQIMSNNSFGTDHGTAAPLMVFGSCVNHGIYGDNPEITSNIAPQEGVPMQYDFRSVYASLLIDWMGASEADVRSILFEDFQKIPFIKDCSAPTSTTDPLREIVASVNPNPCTDYCVVRFENTGHHVRVSVLNALGSELSIPVNKNLEKGPHEIRLAADSLVPGSYFVRIAVDDRVKTLKFIRI